MIPTHTFWHSLDYLSLLKHKPTDFFTNIEEELLNILQDAYKCVYNGGM